jgi:serine-type D-Ala-D-Ala carboxypeptidase/endopeptidase (penicillin-binding protein 4)
MKLGIVARLGNGEPDNCESMGAVPMTPNIRRKLRMRLLRHGVPVLLVVGAMASITFGLAIPANAFGADRSPAQAGAAKAGHTKDDSRNRALDVRIQEILRRPEFRNARWGMKFYSPDANEVVYALNADQLFNPASAMKVFVAGTAFSALGADYRFHTSVYRTGPVENGVLRGDLVLVASGDLLLGGRVLRDGTLALPERDHTYDMSPGAVPVSADPLRSIHDLVEQIAAHGIRRVEGRVLVDASLFREAKGEAGGTGQVVISPIMINDNLVDVVVRPASRVGDAGSVRVAPETAYVKIVNKTRTTAAAAGTAVVLMRRMGPGALQFTDDVTNADGSHTVNLTGDIALGSRPVLCAYRVPEPVRFAEMLLVEALVARGISARVDLLTRTDEGALAAFYRPENRVAELVSPPLSDEVKPMLKLSSNPQTLHFAYLVGAIAGHEKQNARQAGQEIQQKLFEKAGVSRGVKQGGELGMDRYSADAFITFLTYMSHQPWFAQYLHALPILGKDGTVAKVQAGTPAAGHVWRTGSGPFRVGPHRARPLQGWAALGAALSGLVAFWQVEKAAFEKPSWRGIHPRWTVPQGSVKFPVSNFRGNSCGRPESSA